MFQAVLTAICRNCDPKRSENSSVCFRWRQTPFLVTWYLRRVTWRKNRLWLADSAGLKDGGFCSISSEFFRLSMTDADAIISYFGFFFSLTERQRIGDYMVMGECWKKIVYPLKISLFVTKNAFSKKVSNIKYISYRILMSQCLFFHVTQLVFYQKERILRQKHFAD